MQLVRVGYSVRYVSSFLSFSLFIEKQLIPATNGSEINLFIERRGSECCRINVSFTSEMNEL